MPESMHAAAASAGLFQKFNLILQANPSDPPDFRLVIFEVPTPGHPRLTKAPPLGHVRPDLLSKPVLAYQPDRITTLPAQRLIYLGDGHEPVMWENSARAIRDKLNRNRPAK